MASNGKSTGSSADREPDAHRAEIDAVLTACRSLVAIAARSVEAVADQVDLVQLRILVVLSARGTASLSEVAEECRLHLTRASRQCDRLVGMDLITRVDDPEDRRSLQLSLTPAGHEIVARVTDARRESIAPVLARLSPTRRAELLRSLRDFSAAEVAVTDGRLAELAWTQ